MPLHPNKIPQARDAEEFVVQVLLHQNWKILGRNFRKVGCEIDLIAMKESTIIFVEVKFRRYFSNTLQGIEQTIRYRQRKALERGALCFLQWHEEDLPRWETLRFDLALVTKAARKYNLQYFADFHHETKKVHREKSRRTF